MFCKEGEVKRGKAKNVSGDFNADFIIVLLFDNYDPFRVGLLQQRQQEVVQKSFYKHWDVIPVI